MHAHRHHLDERHEVLQILILCVFECALHLIGVVVDANDFCAGESGNLTCGTPHTTSTVKHGFARGQLELQSEKVLVTRQRLCVGLSLALCRKVE